MRELLLTGEILAPLFLLLALGWLMRRVGWMRPGMTRELNQLIFRLFLPALVFNNVRQMAPGTGINWGYAAFLFGSLMAVFLLCMALVPRFEKDRRKQGVMVQGIFRTNFAALGAPLMEAMFGATGLTAYALALPIVIPMNNVLAVVALCAAGEKRPSWGEMLKSVFTNPLIVACLLGGAMLLADVQLPQVVDTAVEQLGSLASPLALLVLGASLQWEGVKDNRGELAWTVLLKQLLIPCAMLALAVALGFRGQELGVMMILYGAPCAISSYPMAEAMGGDGDLAASQVVLTTVFSMGTLFALIYAGKWMGWI